MNVTVTKKWWLEMCIPSWYPSPLNLSWSIPEYMTSRTIKFFIWGLGRFSFQISSMRFCWIASSSMPYFLRSLRYKACKFSTHILQSTKYWWMYLVNIPQTCGPIHLRGKKINQYPLFSFELQLWSWSTSQQALSQLTPILYETLFSMSGMRSSNLVWIHSFSSKFLYHVIMAKKLNYFLSLQTQKEIDFCL